MDWFLDTSGWKIEDTSRELKPQAGIEPATPALFCISIGVESRSAYESGALTDWATEASWNEANITFLRKDVVMPIIDSLNLFIKVFKLFLKSNWVKKEKCGVYIKKKIF